MAVLVQEAASHRIDEIYRYTRARWGDAQADAYIFGLFDAFDRIATREVLSRPIPAEFGVDGFFSAMKSISSTGNHLAGRTSAL